MRDQYAGQPGSFIVDPEASIRIPAADWDIYQSNKSAYLADPVAASAAFAAKPAKSVKEKGDAELS